MPVTLRITGKLRDPQTVRAIVEEVTEVAATLGWKHKIVLDAPPSLQGITLTPDADSRPLALLFDRHGVLRDAVSHDDAVTCTTHARETHTALSKLLKHLHKRYFATMEIAEQETKAKTKRASRPHPEDEPDAAEAEQRIAEAAREARYRREDAEDPGRAALDRLNGPQPPFIDDEEEWDFDRWVEFWRRWDEHRCPMLAAMRGQPETIASIEAARIEEKKAHERDEIDQRLVRRRLRRLRKRKPSRDFDFDFPEPEPQEAWKESAPPPVEPEERPAERTSPAFAQANDWVIRFHKRSGNREMHPAEIYVWAAVLPAIVGTRMAVTWRDRENMLRAVPSRLAVCAERFEHVSRILRLAGAAFEKAADEAAAIARKFRREVRG